MNKVYIKIFSTLIVFAATSHLLQANSIPKEIVTCFKTGNSAALAEFFYDNIELQVLDDENVYSKTQAEQIIKKFFTTNKPSNFSIFHESGKEGAEYAIGTLRAEKGTFRVYLLLKTQGSKQYIHQLYIKKEDEKK